VNTTTDKSTPRREPIGYVRREIPEIPAPSYPDERYEALVPDTLDLQERAALAVNVLTRATDPEADYELFFNLDCRRNPPLMDHNQSSMCGCKFMEALPLMRRVSGSRENLDVDRVWRQVALRSLSADGDYCYPLRGRPWALIGPWFAMGGGYEENIRKRDQVLIPVQAGRMLSAMMNYAAADGSDLWHREAKRLVDGLAGLAVDRDGYAFFSPSAIHAERGSSVDVGRDRPGQAAMSAWAALGLVHAFQGTGYEPALALALAGKLLKHLLEECRFLGADGSFGPHPSRYRMDADGEAADRERLMKELRRESLGVGEIGEVWDYLAPKYQHFHTNTYVLLAVLEYALAAGNRSWIELARKGFEFGKAHGNTLIGYFPELLGRPNFETSELCEVADMIALGIKLSRAGVGDYWDDVDRWARNLFAEGQLTPARAERLNRFVSGLPVTPIDANTYLSGQNIRVSGYHSTDRVIERNIGGFAGWPSPNDWGTAIMHCCTGNSTRSIYYLWDSILAHADGKLKVNLLLNRASPWADVDSHLPYTGRVDVNIKQPVDLAVRIPEWVKPGEVRCAVAGVERPPAFDGRYARVGAVQAGQTATLTFPNPERTESVWIEKHPYTLYLKGNTVVEIDPPGTVCPLFQRAHYRENVTRWRKIERFVAAAHG